MNLMKKMLIQIWIALLPKTIYNWEKGTKNWEKEGATV
jgi:hypothetical protein